MRVSRVPSVRYLNHSLKVKPYFKEVSLGAHSITYNGAGGGVTKRRLRASNGRVVVVVALRHTDTDRHG